jgi:hypothetical protein
MFVIFFFLSVGLNGFFSGVVLWAFWKIVFWVYLFAKMLPRADVKLTWADGLLANLVQITENAGVAIVKWVRGLLHLQKRRGKFHLGFNPDYDDSTDFKFGMAELHLPYNVLCWCMLVALIYIKLQSLNSLDVNPQVQETGFISRGSMIMNAVLAMGVGTVIAFGPMCSFYWRLMKCGMAKRKKIMEDEGKLNEQIRELESKLEKLDSSTNARLRQLAEEIETRIKDLKSRRDRLQQARKSMEKQQTWPWKDFGFISAAAAFCGFFIAPEVVLALLSILPIPSLKRDVVEAWIRFPVALRAVVWEHEAKVHHLPNDATTGP